MAKEKKVLTQADFELVQSNVKIHDKAFDTKPTTFFKDAVKRFCKNKSSIVAFGIIAILVLLAIFLPIFSNKNVDYIEKREAFLEPKLFDAGFGFWDGTRKYKNIVLDTTTGLPAEFYGPGVLDLEIVGKEYIDNTNNYGLGGYAVLINDGTLETSLDDPATLDVVEPGSTRNTTLYSYPTIFTADGNYTVTVKPYNKEGYNNGELAEYSVSIRYPVKYMNKDDKEETKYEQYLIKDFSRDYSEFTLNISEYLKENGIERLEDSSLQFNIKPSSTQGVRSYLMFEQIIFNADESVENYKDLTESISLLDANKSFSLELNANREKPLGYWSATSIKNVHAVEIFKCNFTYDTYAEPYADEKFTYAYSELESLKKKGYCDFDKNDIPGTFVNLNPDKCPVSEVTGVKYASITGKPLEVYCAARGYLTYKHGTDENTYTQAPRFLFGTDDKGHDVFKKSFRGLRTSLILGVCTAAFCFAFGLVWGAISGYFGGMVDLIMERIIEIIGGIPTTILLTLMILKFGNNFFVFVTALCLTGWIGTAGRTRTQFYRFKGREYVLASRTLGSSDIRLIFKHILPNSMGTIITGSVLMVTSVIYSEASLAYLQLGLQGTSSFGVMMSDNQQYLQSYPYLVLEPAVIISLMMISFNLFGNGLRDAFNPSLKGSE